MRSGDNQTINLTLINGDQNSLYYHLTVTIEEMGNSTNFIEYETPAIVFAHFNSSANIDLQLTVSENASDGYAAVITILAESANNRDVSDFVNLNVMITTAPPPEFTENEVSNIYLKVQYQSANPQYFSNLSTNSMLKFICIYMVQCIVYMIVDAK